MTPTKKERKFKMHDQVRIWRDGKKLFASILCELDHHTAKRIREKIDKELYSVRPDALVIDFSGVGFMDSSGVGLILGRAESASSVGAKVIITGLSPILMKLIRLSGVERVRGVKIEDRIPIKKEGKILK